MIQIVQLWSERNRRDVSLPVKFAASLVTDLTQIVLTPVGLEVSVSEVTHAGVIDRIEDNSRTLGRVNGFIQVRIDWAGAVVRINAAADDQRLARLPVGRPVIDEILHSNVYGLAEIPGGPVGVRRALAARS